ncbi:MAG: hypothetical protein E7265_06985 [Lachnospiraceae bacterium]|nr:hypothetical protein [Lachnospiraceae bacterium]
MDVNIVESTYSQVRNTKEDYSKKAEDVSKGKQSEKAVPADKAAVYEKSENDAANKSKGKIYEKSAVDREALVKQLKAEQERRQQQFIALVRDMISKQGKTFAGAQDDSIWKFLASGDFEVDAETKAQAQADIAEDGYWGVTQTSERIFDFAMALAGDDEKAMHKMQKAFEKGFKEATGAWGKELPEISQKTYDAVQKKFEEYYESKKVD